jgi:hypothetical protein
MDNLLTLSILQASILRNDETIVGLLESHSEGSR